MAPSNYRLIRKLSGEVAVCEGIDLPFRTFHQFFGDPQKTEKVFEALSALQHASIPFPVGLEPSFDGRLAVVSGYKEIELAGEWMRRNRPKEAWVPVVTRLCEALAYALSRNLVPVQLTVSALFIEPSAQRAEPLVLGWRIASETDSESDLAAALGRILLEGLCGFVPLGNIEPARLLPEELQRWAEPISRAIDPTRPDRFTRLVELALALGSEPMTLHALPDGLPETPSDAPSDALSEAAVASATDEDWKPWEGSLPSLGVGPQNLADKSGSIPSNV